MKLPAPYRRPCAAHLVPLLLVAVASGGPILADGGQIGADAPMSMSMPAVEDRPPPQPPVSPSSAMAPGSTMAPSAETAHTHTHAGMSTGPVYVCPMHPQVMSAEPGRCPVCGMDLVVTKADMPAADQSSPAAAMEMPVVTVADAVVDQLGVRTTPVRRGSLTRHIEAPGVFLRSTPRGGVRPLPQSPVPGTDDTGAFTPTLMVLGQVFEREAPLIHEGQTARVRFPGLGTREWTGKVASLETQISQTTHTLQFRVTADNEGSAVPSGMAAVVTVEMEPLRDVLLVPREAVIRTGKGARVMVALGEGRFQPRAVAAEDLGEDEILIRSGLREGEEVVVSAQFLLDSEADLQAGLKRLSGLHAAPSPAARAP